jgi:hypothetical protein
VADYTWAPQSGLEFKGIALGTAAALGIYHLMRALARWRGTSAEPASPASVPGGTELEGRTADLAKDAV